MQGFILAGISTAKKSTLILDMMQNIEVDG